MFIKPGVYQTNAKAWAQFDEHQAQQRQVVKQLGGSSESAELTDWGGSDSDSDVWSDSEDSDASSPAAETVGTRNFVGVS